MSNEEKYHMKRVKIKHDLSDCDIKKGDTGFISGYLPADNMFNIIFDNKIWITFEENEAVFLDRVELVE